MTDAYTSPDFHPARPILQAGARVGRFQVERLLGTGGMGEVYQAWDTGLERRVALKALRSQAEREGATLERFRREALALAQLNHPNVCQVHDWVDTPNGTFIAMELLEGQTLDQAAPDLTLPEKLRVIQAVAVALEAAHAKGLVHRDLKPSNIMVDLRLPSRELGVKVLDFGLARLADTQGQTGHSTPSAVPTLALAQALEAAASCPGDGSSSTALAPGDGEARPGSGSHSWERLTQMGVFMGSPGYASPEQIQGQAAGSSSDIFSLGILGWELLSNEHPFPGEGKARMRAIVDGTRRDLKVRGLPSGTADLLRSMLEPHPFKRPTATRVAETLDRLLKPRTFLRWSAATAVTALALTGGALWFTQRGIVPDLTRRRPARVLVLPFQNATGLADLDPLSLHTLPSMVGAALRDQPKLAVVDPELLVRARRELRLPEGPLTVQDQGRLADALGAQLLLRGQVGLAGKGQFTLAYDLVDRQGRVRQAGEVREGRGNGSIAIPLARRMSTQISKAVDPLASDARIRLPEVPEPALQAFARASAAMQRSAFKEAAPDFQLAAQLAPDFTPAVLSYARCLMRMGDLNAEPALHWARWSARAQGDRVFELRALLTLAGLMSERAQWEAAERFGQEALALARTLGAPDEEASVHTALGVAQQRQRKSPEAEYRLALEGFQAAGDRLGATRVLNNLAVLERNRGNLAAAEAQFQRALEAVRSYRDQWTEAILTNNLGDLALAQDGGLDRAEGFFLKAKALREAIGDQNGLAYTLVGLASVHQARGDLAKAGAIMQQFLELARRIQQRPLEAQALYNLGELARSAQDYDGARGFYRQSLALHQELKDTGMEALCLAGEAECMAREGRRAMARSLLDRCAILTTEASPYVLRAQGWLARAERRPDDARAAFAKALELARTQAPEIVRELREALKQA